MPNPLHSLHSDTIRRLGLYIGIGSMQIITHNPKETQKTARILAEEILREKPKKSGAFVIGLFGDLGAGKTTFTQGFAKGLGIKEKITSPTFVILKKFKIKQGGRKIERKAIALRATTRRVASYSNFYHFDCYRLSGGEDLKVLGFDEMLKSPKNIILIEWAGNIKDALPKDILKIKFEHLKRDKRKLKITI